MTSKKPTEVTSPEEVSELAISEPEVAQNAINDLLPDTTEPVCSIRTQQKLRSPAWGWFGGALIGVIFGGGAVFALAMLGYISNKDATKTASATSDTRLGGIPGTQAQRPAGGQSNTVDVASVESTGDKNGQKTALSQAEPPAAGRHLPEQHTRTERDSQVPGKQAATKKTPTEPEQTFSKAAEAFARGDLLAAEKAGIETLPIFKPEEYALRGKFRFRRYLQKQALANREISPQDPAIAAAIADLVKANNADGSLELVEVYLRTGDLDLAERTAKEGQAKFDDPRFKTALIDIRLEKAERKKPRSPGGALRSPLGNPVLSPLLATFFTDVSDENEAMPDDLLQTALGLALDKKFTEAISTVELAKVKAARLAVRNQNILSNNKTRNARLIKHLGNQIIAGWEAQELLNKEQYLPRGSVIEPEFLPQAVNRTLADAKPFRQIVAKLSDAKFIGKPEEAISRVDEMIATLQNIRTLLVEQKFVDSTELGKVVPGVHDAVRIAQMKDPDAVIRSLENQVKSSRRAAEVMPAYLITLQDRNTGLERIAREDIIRVDRDRDATSAEKAHAKIVQALVDRNEGKYAEAKLLLGHELPHTEKESVFGIIGTKLLMEVTNPGAYTLNRVIELRSRGQSDQALQLLQTSIDSVPPEERSSLLAQRASMYLDLLLRRAKSNISSNDPLLEKAKNDAAAAGECPEAKYVLGRIAEEMGRRGEATQFYRRAIDLSGRTPNRENALVYRAALLRVLAVPGWLPPQTSRQSTQRLDRNGVGQSNPTDLHALLALATLALQPSVSDGGQPITNAASRNEVQTGNSGAGLPWLANYRQGRSAPIGAAYAEAQAESAHDITASGEIMQHADEILAQGDSAPFNARAVALAVKGQWTDGLLAYAEGLRTQLPGDYSQGLLFLIRNHPLFKQVANRRTDPVSAELLYRQGLELYFQRDYPDAERLLTRSIEASEQNALPHYFQGLAQLAQGKTRKAYNSFESGARLERAGKPRGGAVDLALERIQGNQRTRLEWFRNRLEP